MISTRLYTAGIDDFARIREDSRIYVDKTELVYKLAHESQYVFLSRPRRFGKSLLCSTLKYYFQGRKDLFEGLKIGEYEREWKQYPVFHFDISRCKYKADASEIATTLGLMLKEYEVVYGRDAGEHTPGERFTGLIRRAHWQTGLKAVVILDEYDAPLLDCLSRQLDLNEVRCVMQEFYQPLKICGSDEQFVFITGITKFSQLSIFSALNNLSNISMAADYAAVCGITQKELLTVFDEDLDILAAKYHCSKQEMVSMLKQQYDGYHFGEDSEDIYNPYSLTSAFKLKRLDAFWFESGTSSFLFTEMKRFGTRLLELPAIQVPASQFDAPTEGMQTALPLLYQSGYLTIKGYDFYSRRYTLDFPNAEVKTGFLENFMAVMLKITQADVRGWGGEMYAALYFHDLDRFFRAMRSCFASIPYLDNGNRQLDDLTRFEAYYEVITYIVFSMINFCTYTQVKTALGRTDIVVHLPNEVYVMELKVNGTAEDALQQIDYNEYMVPYEADGRKVVKIGLAFSMESRNVTDWKIIE